VVVLKGIFLWMPAAVIWLSIASGTPILDFRTPEEVEEDENEVVRLERFFDVEHLPEEEYLTEWSVKKEALQGVLDKLLKSKRLLELLAESNQTAEELASVAEFSYILPPAEGGLSSPMDLALGGSEGYRPWNPRLVLSHSSGSLALVTLKFQHVNPAKGRDEKWTCTALRAELIASHGGEPASESICDLQGPLPHGVRYMRI